MPQLKKALWTLNINNYAPEITAVTYPHLKAYASKIGADFNVITERHWPEAPATYEKLQLSWLGEKYDWNIYIDSDALVHPDMFDVTRHIYPDTVMQYGSDLAGTRWRDDKYFRRDTRQISSCNWFTVASNDCLDIWQPLEDLSIAQALENIQPHLKEKKTCSDGHLIDDYVLSRNIARYGLRYRTFLDLLKYLHSEGAQLFFHTHLLTRKEKAYILPRIMQERWEQSLLIDAEWFDKVTKEANAVNEGQV
jgi:hypothetical protein